MWKPLQQQWQAALLLVMSASWLALLLLRWAWPGLCWRRLWRCGASAS
jgi:hypothetical protein